MRTPVMLLVVAMIAVSFDWWSTSPSADVALAQTGPMPTAALNPRLGAPPPGGNLEGRSATRLGDGGAGAVGPTDDALRDRASEIGASAGDAVLPGGRLGTIDDGRVGAPMAGTIPNPAAGAPPAAGAVAPPAAGAVGAQPGLTAPAR